MSLKFLSHIHKRIGFRLTLWYLLIFFLSFLTIFVFAYFFLLSFFERSDRKDIRSQLNECAIEYNRGGLDALKKVMELEKHARGKNIYFVRLKGAQNNTLLLNIPEQEQWAGFDLKQLEKSDTHANKQWLRFRAHGEVIQIASLYFPDGYLLQVGKSTEDQGDLLKIFYKTFVGIVIPVILIGFIGGGFLAFRALQPIRSLINFQRSIIKTGRMDMRVPTRQTGDELEELVVLFNRMLEKIEVLINGMRDSLDNVAHDLRTPMTRLQGIAEMALRSEQNLETTQEALVECAEGAERILNMLNTLMDISEAETGVMKLDLREVCLLNLIENAVELYRYVAEEKNVAIHTVCPPELYVTVDPNRMVQVLANLLDNAIKYSFSDGRVDIEVYQKQQEILITIKDTGVGIPPEELPKIWDRLYRGDKSRSQPGLGLGLSLVQAVVHAHMGYVQATSEPGSGSLFTICLQRKI
jgi:signal transduction histidine kinase